MKKIGFLLVLLLLPIIKANAFYCQYSDISYLKKLAANINASYIYTEANNNIAFSITLTNLQPDLYIVDTITNQTYNYNSSEITLNNYNGGQTVIYKVYTTKQFCEKELLATIRVTLPSYNKFYKDNVCNGISEFELCNRWSSHKLDYDSFVKKVNQYKESLIVKPEDPIVKVPEDNTIIQWIINLLLKYYYIPLTLVVIGSGIGIYIINKKSDTYR